MLKLRDIPILGNVYAVVAALGLVALIVGGIGVDAVYTTTARVRQLEQVATQPSWSNCERTSAKRISVSPYPVSRTKAPSA